MGKDWEVALRILNGLLIAGLLALPAMAQQNSPLGGFKHDRTAPIDITANALEVRQAEQIAVFTGEVVAGQDTLRLTADRVEVLFDEEGQSNSEGTGNIRNLKAQGNVFLSNGAETAQGGWAEYDLETGVVRMTGDVILTQGENAGKGQSLVINLNTGVARLEGSGNNRVSLSFVANSAQNQADSAPKCTQAQIDGAAELGLVNYECKGGTN